MTTKVFISTILALILASCNNVRTQDKQKSGKAKFYKVDVAYEPDFYNESRIDTVELSKPQITDTSKITNGLTAFVRHQSFKIEEGELTISAVSVFERKYLKTVNINSDTTIIFNKRDFPTVFEAKDNWSEKLNLKNIDTVVIYLFNGNCATTDAFASVRQISCFKSDTNYLVKYTELPRGIANNKSTYKAKELGGRFIIHLNDFYNSVKRIKEKNQELISTTNAYLFIRIDNNIFQITDPQFSIGNLYDTLIKKINGS